MTYQYRWSDGTFHTRPQRLHERIVWLIHDLFVLIARLGP